MLSFDGVSNSVEVPDSPSLRPTKGTISLELLFLLESYVDNQAFLFASQLDGARYIIILVKNDIRWEVKSIFGTSVFSGPVLVPQLYKWYHVVVTYDENYISKVYVNEELQKSIQGDGPLAITYRSFSIFKERFSPGWPKGKVALARIYNRALTGPTIDGDDDEKPDCIGDPNNEVCWLFAEKPKVILGKVEV
jgi:hypothetical protein